MRLHSIILSLLLSMGLILLAALTLPAEELTGIGQAPPQAKPAPKPAQQQQDQDEAVRLSSRLVLIPVSATTASGQPVKDLKAEDIVIEEEGRPQQVVALGEPGKTPIEITLLFDVSGSVHGQFAFEQQAAVRFIRAVLKPGDNVSIFSIGLTPKQVKGRTTSGEEAIAGVMAISPVKEATAFFDSIVEASQYMDKNADTGSRRVMVVISDGEENYSRRNTLADALRKLQESDCLFYAINPSGPGIRLNRVSLRGQDGMEAMALQTGGKAFLPDGTEQLQAVFNQITEELQAQYLFGYYSTDERSESGFKRISVRAPGRPDLRIRARQGYYVTKN